MHLSDRFACMLVCRDKYYLGVGVLQQNAQQLRSAVAGASKDRDANTGGRGDRERCGDSGIGGRGDAATRGLGDTLICCGIFQSLSIPHYCSTLLLPLARPPVSIPRIPASPYPRVPASPRPRVAPSPRLPVPTSPRPRVPRVSRPSSFRLPHTLAGNFADTSSKRREPLRLAFAA